AQASLRALATPPPAPETLPSLPSAFRIASIPAHTPADTTNLTDKLETADVAHVLAQAEDALRSGRQAEARALVESALERVTQTRPRFILHHRLGALAFKLRDYDLAITHMKQALDLEPGQAALTCNLAAALMTRGEVAEALDLLSSLHVNLIRNARLRFSVHFNLACAHALSGNIDQAVSNLQHAAHYDAYATMASAGDTQLDAIRNDPRVQDLIRGLEQEHLGALREPSNLIQ
ncbi:MAG: tetratricopeptide repeat protein, partial [Kiritimatiellae bacterium]|nr:tetratricopeptide repeat protein [Kiritimatiellia bacterium]